MRSKILRSVAVVAAVSAPLLAAPAAHATTAPSGSHHASPRIIGGQPASNPDVVQLQFEQNGGTYGCSGELISSEWVLTAQHCTDGDTSMNVYVSNSTSNPGDPIAVDDFENSPNGDMALVHLSQPVQMDSYMQMADSYTPKSGQSGVIMGYGLRANQTPTDSLYQASVRVLGASTDAYNGDAIHIQGVSGSSNHGDSGGPLLINGQIVGVCSTGDSADPGANTHAGSNYANITGSRDWINQVTGL